MGESRVTGKVHSKYLPNTWQAQSSLSSPNVHLYLYYKFIFLSPGIRGVREQV
jgi:hypothetical protein